MQGPGPLKSHISHAQDLLARLLAFLHAMTARGAKGLAVVASLPPYHVVSIFEAVFTRAYGTEDAKVTGPKSAMLAYLEDTDWAKAGRDLLVFEFYATEGLFQSTVMMKVPNNIFGISTSILHANWENDDCLLDMNSVRDATAEFCDKNVDSLKRLWQENA